MLVLTRKCHQAVVVEGCGGPAERLTVTVIEIRGARVKLGFEVAKEVIHRQEVWEQINGNDPPDADSSGHALPDPDPGAPVASTRRIAL
jgi:carbon storage regulator CsrA